MSFFAPPGRNRRALVVALLVAAVLPACTSHHANPVVPLHAPHIHGPLSTDGMRIVDADEPDGRTGGIHDPRSLGGERAVDAGGVQAHDRIRMVRRARWKKERHQQAHREGAAGHAGLTDKAHAATLTDSPLVGAAHARPLPDA